MKKLAVGYSYRLIKPTISNDGIFHPHPLLQPQKIPHLSNVKITPEIILDLEKLITNTDNSGPSTSDISSRPIQNSENNEQSRFAISAGLVEDNGLIQIAFEIMETVKELKLPLQVKNITPGKDSSSVIYYAGHYLS